MEYEQRISKTDLARSTHQVIREALRGYTVAIPARAWAYVIKRVGWICSRS